MQKLFEKILFYLGLFIFFIIPLFFADIGIYFGFDFFRFETLKIFELPKVLLFFILSGIWIILYVCSLIFFKSENYKPTKISESFLFKILMFGLVFFVFISNIFSLYFPSTLFGIVERGNGFILFCQMIIFTYLFCINFLTDFKRRVVFYRILVLGAFLISLICILQKFGIDPVLNLYNIDFLVGRVFGTFGNPNYVATYFVFIFPILGILIYEKSENKINKYFYLGVFLICLIALFFTESRAGILGFLVSMILVIYFSLKKINLKYLFFGLVLGILILFLLNLNFSTINRFVPNTSNMRSLNTRLLLWENGIKLISERFLIGYGMDTFYSSGLKNVDPKILRFENLNDRPDRFHNHFLDFIYENGVLAFLFYLALVFYILRLGFFSGNNEFIFLSISIFSVLITDQFGFFLISHRLIFWAFLFIIYFNSFDKKYSNKIYNSFIYYNGIFILFLVGLVSFFTGIFWWKAENFAYANDYEKAIAVWPYGVEYYDKLLLNKDLSLDKFEYYLSQYMNLRKDEIYAYISILSRNDISFERKQKAFFEGQKIAPYFPPLWILYLEILKIQDMDLFKQKMDEFLLFIPDTWKLQNKINLTFEESERLRLFWKHNPRIKQLLEY